MITLAQRVRDFRYSKGWGPDELASRAEISRTALYQIESGKTGLPRAGTLRRIAVALDVSMDELLGNGEPATSGKPRSAHEHPHFASRGRELLGLDPCRRGSACSAARQCPCGSSHQILSKTPGTKSGSATEPQRRAHSAGLDSLLMREGEMMSKLHDLLHSPMGPGIARIVDDLHVMIAKPRNSS